MTYQMLRVCLEFAFDAENTFGMMKVKLFLSFIAGLWSEKKLKYLVPLKAGSIIINVLAGQRVKFKHALSRMIHFYRITVL